MSQDTAQSQRQDVPDVPEFVTIDEWRRIMRIGRSKAYDAVRQNQVPHLRFGKIIRIPRSAIEVQ